MLHPVEKGKSHKNRALKRCKKFAGPLAQGVSDPRHKILDEILGRHYEKTNEAIFYKFFDPLFLSKNRGFTKNRYHHRIGRKKIRRMVYSDREKLNGRPDFDTCSFLCIFERIWGWGGGALYGSSHATPAFGMYTTIRSSCTRKRSSSTRKTLALVLQIGRAHV